MTMKRDEKLVLFKSKYLNNRESKNSLKDMLGEDIYNYFIVKDETDFQYKAFSNVSSYEIYMNHTPMPKRCFHEVIFGNRPQRIRFDIDCEKSNLNKLDWNAPKFKDIKWEDPKDKLVAFIGNTILQTFKELYAKELNECSYLPTNKDLIITQSHSTVKVSFHIILKGFKLKNNKECEEFYKIVNSKLPSTIQNFLDGNVYKTTQHFRLLGSTKLNENRYKKFATINSGIDEAYIQGTGMNGGDEFIKTKLCKNEDLQNSCIDLDERTIELIVNEVHTKFTEFVHRPGGKGNVINFNRTSASHCSICNRVHDKDNTLYAYVINDVAYWSCLHDKNSNPTKKMLLELNAYNRDLELRKKVEYAKNNPINFDEDKYGEHLIVYDEPRVRDITSVETEFICAPMKLGKTKTLVKCLKQQKELSVCVLSFRCSFTKNIRNSLGEEFIEYNNIKGKQISADKYPKVIVQVESLYRIQGKYDVIVLDESESIYGQFQSGNIKNLSIAFANFERLMKCATKVICMDAFLSDRTIDCTNKIRNKPYKIYHNVYQNAKDYKYNLCHYTNNDYFHTKIKECLQGGKNIGIMANRKVELEAIRDKILDDFPDIDIEIYTSSTDAKIKELHMSDVNKYWKKRVILYSPTITAGVSFEEVWFDQLFAMFTNNSCDVLSCMQMLGRIRNLKDKEITIGLDVKGINCSIDTESIKRDVIKGRMDLINTISNIKIYPEIEDSNDTPAEKTRKVMEPYRIDEDDNYFLLWLMNEKSNNFSKKKFIYYLCSCIFKTGAQIEVYDTIKGELSKIIKRAKKLIKEKEATAIAHADMPDADEIEEIENKQKDEIQLTETESIALKKYRLPIHYDVPVENADCVDWVLAYHSDVQRLIYRNLKRILKYKDYNKSLEYLKETDVYVYKRYGKDRINRFNVRIHYMDHQNAMQSIKYIGFDGLFDTRHLNIQSMHGKISKNTEHLNNIITYFNYYPPVNNTLNYIKSINRILNSMYDCSIVPVNKDSDDYKIKLTKRYKLIYNNKPINSFIMETSPEINIID